MSPSKESENQNDKRHYLLSLDRRLLFYTSIMLSILLASFFLVGFLVGNKIEGVTANNQSGVQLAGGAESNLKDISNKITPANADGETSSVFRVRGNNRSNPEGGLVFEDYVNTKDLLDQDKNAGRVANFITSEGKNDKAQQIALKNRSSESIKSETEKNVDKAELFEKNPIGGKNYYFIQVIASKDENKAKKIAEGLRSKKYLAIIHQKQDIDTGSSIFLVRVGLYKDKKVAIDHLKKIRKSTNMKDAFLNLYTHPK